MVGFPYFFHVNAGHPVLKHPLYLKYNTLSLEAISQLDGGNGFRNLIDEMAAIMQTNDNMPILWYMRTLEKTARELGIIE
jgi:hypothetical protein